MTILEAGKKLKDKLATIYNNREAENITDMVLENITGYSKSERLIYKTKLLNDDQLKKLNNHINELMLHKPVQYVLHEAWFAGMKFYVDENVLIPRPETEELVEWIVQDFKFSIANLKLTILDIGSGSGCIAIALKKKLPFGNVYALDINDKALEITLKNAVANDAEIELIHADILNVDKQQSFSIFDIIVSNPPYIKQSEANQMAENVLKYEPASALFVPDENALLFYNAIADFALINLNDNGKLYFEINETLGNEVASLLAAKGFSNIILKKDLQGKDRMISSNFKTLK